ncbi:MAG TPA: response regulator transcription factor [Candidatus Limnocylindrales bacterium]|nr:response regulator transcription factor [Candidatus Limnocylindrales bacterium]
MSDRARVLVADDHELFRRGVIDALGASDEFAVVAQCATAHDAAVLARVHLPDLVLLDLGLPDRSGLDLVGEIHRTCPVSRIVVLTVSEDERALLRALREGASAYVLKGASADELLRALRAVRAGEGYVSPALASQLLREMTPTARDLLDALSEREREVLAGIAAGETNKEIAVRLRLSEKTVKYYVTNVLIKLHVRSRVEAALVAQGRARPA